MGDQPPLSPRLEHILLDLIDAGIWATRERLGYRQAIHTIDHESEDLQGQPYSTNLDIRFDALAEQRADLLEQIADYIASEILAGDRTVKLIGPTAFRIKKYTVAVLNRIIDRLGLDLVEHDELEHHDNLVLLAGAHSPELVEFWGSHNDRIAKVITLLGTRRQHIERDLKLPAEKYYAFASWDALERIAPDRRWKMIPGAHTHAPMTSGSGQVRQEYSSSLPIAPTDQADAGVGSQLLQLKEYVRQITFPGEFLLSVNKFSDSWLYIVKFNTRAVRQVTAQILRHTLSRYLSHQNEAHVLFCSEFGQLSEDEFATAHVANDAFRALKHDLLSFERYWAPDHGVIHLNADAFKGKRAIGLFVLSIHVDFLLDIIAKIRAIGGEVAAIIAIIERDDVGRGAFAAQGVDLIPFILWEADQKDLTTVLERAEATYTPYRALFE
jgi:hypothetical protein